MDDSTTPVSDDQGAGAPAQPDQSPDTQAADTQPDVSTQTADTTDATEAGSSTAVDDNLAWLTNKGIDPNSPEALAKVAEMYRNAETQLRSTRNDAKLDTSITEAAQQSEYAQDASDPTSELQQRLNRLELERNVDKFFSQEGIDASLRTKMAETAQQNPNLAYLVENGVLSLQDMYNMVRGSDPTLLNQAKQDGGREALQKVADKQQAKAVPGNATSSQMATGGPTRETRDAWYQSLTPEQRASSETQQILNSLL